MKYKPLSDAHSLSMRSNYLKNKYCPNELISSKNFVEQIKTAYYKYDAPLYQPGYNQSLKTQFDSFFHNLREDKIIVDIGAGTGDSYWLVKNSSYSFSKYYFIEPFKSMIDKFEDKDNSKVVIVNDYFESTKCTEMIRKEKKPIIFIMCAVLRTIDNIDEFIDILKMNLKYGDQIFLPVEPNNEYFGKYYKYLTTIIKPLIISRLVLKKAKDLIIRNYSSAKNSEKIDEKSPLVNALDHLKKTRIVNDEFTVTMLYAIVYYNNYFCVTLIPMLSIL